MAQCFMFTPFHVLYIANGAMAQIYPISQVTYHGIYNVQDSDQASNKQRILKGLAMILAGQENPLINFRSKERYRVSQKSAIVTRAPFCKILNNF